MKIQNTAYDGAGNQTVRGGYTLQYDAAGRMERSTISGAATLFAYDADGRRVFSKKAGGNTTYVYDAFGQVAAGYTTVPVASACTTRTLQ